MIEQCNIIYEKNVALDNCYKFCGKETLKKFINNLISLFNEKELDCTFYILSDCGSISFRDLENFDSVVETLKSIYKVNLTIKNISGTKQLSASLSEIENIKNNSYIKLKSNSIDWINNSINQIKDRLSIYVRKVSFLKNPGSQVILLSILLSILFTYIDVEELNSVSLLAYLAYGFLLFVICHILTMAFLPTFKITTKPNIIARFKVSLSNNDIVNKTQFIWGLLGFLVIIKDIIKFIYSIIFSTN